MAATRRIEASHLKMGAIPSWTCAPYQTAVSYTHLYYIEDHLEEDLTLEKLAAAFYVSKYHIAHVFKDSTGLSVHQYIMKKRLFACKNAIPDCENISDVYLQFGFKDYSSFYRAFKKEFGISPKEYKSQCTNTPLTPAN